MYGLKKTKEAGGLKLCNILCTAVYSTTITIITLGKLELLHMFVCDLRVTTEAQEKSEENFRKSE